MVVNYHQQELSGVDLTLRGTASGQGRGASDPWFGGAWGHAIRHGVCASGLSRVRQVVR
jgi:hypothetical protein